MQSIRNFIKTSVIGGVIVLLPIGILLVAFRWIFGLITGWIEPLTTQVTDWNEDIEHYSAIGIVIGLIVLSCFVIGVIVRWRVGSFIHHQLENHILKIAPGYNLIKETVLQFLGNRPSPFSSVALVQIFGNETLATAFVTERHDNGMYSVFIPTGPNPTSGQIFHLQPQYVHHIDQPVEDVMRSIISCGAGSDKLIKAAADKTDIVPAAPASEPATEE